MNDIASAISQATDATTEYRAQLICENVVRNLRYVDEYPSAPGAFEISGNVFVCGAGISLNKNLANIKQGDGVIVCVNTPSQAVIDAGLRIDMFVSMEALPLPDQLAKVEKHVNRIILDLSAHPTMWERAVASGVPIAWFLGPSPHTMGLCEVMGVEPVYHGASAMTAAFDLCVRNGDYADIVLLGMDLGYEPEGGPVYCKGSAWDGLTYRVDGDRLVFEGREDRDELHVANGIPPIPRRRKYWRVPSWDNSHEVMCTLELIEEQRWLSTRASIGSGSTRYFNATRGGARIEGFAEDGYSLGWSELCWKGGKYAGRHDKARAYLLEESNNAKRLADHWLSGGDLSYETLMNPPVFVQSLAASDLIAVRREMATGPAKLRATYEIIHAAAERVEQLLG